MLRFMLVMTKIWGFDMLTEYVACERIGEQTSIPATSLVMSPFADKLGNERD
jgi:hypothetical protein